MKYIRNIAIIAHVDHGKTTLVDAMLKQTHTFRDNQKEMNETLIMDSNDLEKEKGITITSKNTSVFYKENKINIIDTPGHADFGGEVERVLNMADGAILLVDAAEGPLPQTRFVLRKALQEQLKIILLINKIDKKDARPKKILKQVEDLFLELATDESALQFSVLYTVGRDGKSFYNLPEKYDLSLKADLTPLFETIIKDIPNSLINKEKPFQMLISTLDYDSYVGRLSIGKVHRGILKRNSQVTLVSDNKVIGKYKVQKLFTYRGLNKEEVDEVISGDIAAIAGINQLSIGQTLTNPEYIESLPSISVEEPTIKIGVGPNTSPFFGREGKFCTSRQIKERLLKEKEINLGLKIVEEEGGKFTVYGRGELHLSILIETMRREGFEMEVSKPEVVYKTIDGVVSEPYEQVIIKGPKEFLGVISEEMGKRQAELKNLVNLENNYVKLAYRVSSNNLIGINTVLLTKMRGKAEITSFFLEYGPKGVQTKNVRNGALISVKSGISLSYGLANAQERGNLFVGPRVEVYEGMVVGIANREKDIEVNVCKAKNLTNNRSVGEGVSIQLVPPLKISLEQALGFINEDEFLEVTPKAIRIRKKYLTSAKRRVELRKKRK